MRVRLLPMMLKAVEQLGRGAVDLTYLSSAHQRLPNLPVTPSPSSLTPPLAGNEPTALIRPFISAPCTSCLGLCATLPIFSFEILAMYADFRLLGVATAETGRFSSDEGASGTVDFGFTGEVGEDGSAGNADLASVEGTLRPEASRE